MTSSASYEGHSDQCLFVQPDKLSIQRAWSRQLSKPISNRHFYEYILTKTLAVLINALPLAASTWIARGIGDVLFLLMRKRRRVALDNLNIAFGESKSKAEKRMLALESFRHLIASLTELCNMRKFENDSKKYFSLEGVNHLETAFNRGKGAILVMSHLGPWELLGFVPHLTKHPCTVLAKTIRNPYISEWVQLSRRIVSVETCDEVSGTREILTQLGNNQLVAIAIDQWAGNDGLWIDFFGQPASTTSFPARLAKKTGCALVPAYCLRKGHGKYEIQIKQEILISKNRDDYVERTTKELNHQLEKQILECPEQWLWTHKRWKGKKFCAS